MKLLILLLLIFILFYYYYTKENWTVYKQKPYNYYLSGSSPLGFYRRDRYRKPFRFPFTYNTSYLLDSKTYYN